MFPYQKKLWEKYQNIHKYIKILKGREETSQKKYFVYNFCCAQDPCSSYIQKRLSEDVILSRIKVVSISENPPVTYIYLTDYTCFINKISEFAYFLNGMDRFDLNKIEHFIMKQDSSVVKTIKKGFEERPPNP